VTENKHAICDYEGSDYQERFWDQGGRQYEDRVEAVALKKLMPAKGQRLLEVGAGAGRNVPRYENIKQIVLVDYARSQLVLAQKRLGGDQRCLFVVADAYQLPFAPNVFDVATMIRTLHHMVDPLAALQQVRSVLQQESVFILEFANKRNLKAILRWVTRMQDWNPFNEKPIEFADMNFNFHPNTIRGWLKNSDFKIKRQLTVSHFRTSLLKRLVPLPILVGLDSMAQSTGRFWQLTPSVFIQAVAIGASGGLGGDTFWRCPVCGSLSLEEQEKGLKCKGCSLIWSYRDGIYDFKEPLDTK
jgi:ubiquinone/menaquinone biosynthesis C-methylase UbiE